MRRYLINMTIGLFVAMAFGLAGCGGGDGGGDGSGTSTATTQSTASKPFPIGTWVGPHNITITVKALVNKSGTDNYYSGSVKYPAFSGGIVSFSGGLTEMGTINYVQNNALAVSANSFSSSSNTVFAFIGDGTSDYNMAQPITSLSGQLVIVSSIPGYSYSERATFTKQ